MWQVAQLKFGTGLCCTRMQLFDAARLLLEERAVGVIRKSVRLLVCRWDNTDKTVQMRLLCTKHTAITWGSIWPKHNVAKSSGNALYGIARKACEEQAGSRSTKYCCAVS